MDGTSTLSTYIREVLCVTPVQSDSCALHDTYEKWNQQRWDAQEKRNDSITDCVERLRIEISSIKQYIWAGIGVMSAIQLLGPTIIKLLGLPR